MRFSTGFINYKNKMIMAEEMEGKSHYKRVKETLDELVAEFATHYKLSEWDGDFVEHHDPELNKASKELVVSPNYFEVIPSGKKCTKDNSLYLTIQQQWFDKIVSGEKDVEYRDITYTMASKYLDFRESSDGYIQTNQWLNEEGILFFDAYNDGIFAYLPRYYEYLRLAVGYSKDRDTAVVRIKGVGFVPAKYHKGGPFRMDYEDTSITDEDIRVASKQGGEAVQDLLYKDDGPDTRWFVVYHLGEIIELNQK